MFSAPLIKVELITLKFIGDNEDTNNALFVFKPKDRQTSKLSTVNGKSTIKSAVILLAAPNTTLDNVK